MAEAIPLPVRKEGLPPPWLDFLNFLLSELLASPGPPPPPPPLLLPACSFLEPQTDVIDSSSELPVSLNLGRGFDCCCFHPMDGSKQKKRLLIRFDSRII